MNIEEIRHKLSLKDLDILSLKKQHYTSISSLKSLLHKRELSLVEKNAQISSLKLRIAQISSKNKITVRNTTTELKARHENKVLKEKFSILEANYENKLKELDNVGTFLNKLKKESQTMFIDNKKLVEKVEVLKRQVSESDKLEGIINEQFYKIQKLEAQIEYLSLVPPIEQDKENISNNEQEKESEFKDKYQEVVNVVQILRNEIEHCLAREKMLLEEVSKRKADKHELIKEIEDLDILVEKLGASSAEVDIEDLLNGSSNENAVGKLKNRIVSQYAEYVGGGCSIC
eukprot:snap_masked-scaffold_45-processed-gene-1.73-mRNA-1 protein AED:1.00 eAED:1.00 QI:0/-1/0/0/-1/1/1/0/287